jgi:hypothetical protein
MTIRTFVDKNGNSWEWEETPELQKALEKLHNQNLKRPHERPTNNS